MAVLAIGFMVSHHAADKEVQQKGFLRIGGAIEHVQFVIRMGDNLFLVLFRFFVLLEQLRNAEFL